MDTALNHHFANLHTSKTDERYASFMHILHLAEEPVDWAPEVWEQLLGLLTSGDNHQRAIAAQLLNALAKSDRENRLVNDIHLLLAATRDHQFVTARHSLQCLWKSGIASPVLQQKVIDHLRHRFSECASEKNCTLIRYDIIDVLRKMYDHTMNVSIKRLAFGLIEQEPDKKYAKKYLSLWKGIE